MLVKPRVGWKWGGAEMGVVGQDAVEEERARSEAQGLKRGGLSSLGTDHDLVKVALVELSDSETKSLGRTEPMRSRRRRSSSPASAESCCGVVDDRLRGCKGDCGAWVMGFWNESSLSETRSFSRAEEPKFKSIPARRRTKLLPWFRMTMDCASSESISWETLSCCCCCL